MGQKLVWIEFMAELRTTCTTTLPTNIYRFQDGIMNWSMITRSRKAFKMRVHSLIPKSSIKTLKLIIRNFNLNFDSRRAESSWVCSNTHYSEMIIQRGLLLASLPELHWTEQYLTTSLVYLYEYMIWGMELWWVGIGVASAMPSRLKPPYIFQKLQ